MQVDESKRHSSHPWCPGVRALASGPGITTKHYTQQWWFTSTHNGIDITTLTCSCSKNNFNFNVKLRNKRKRRLRLQRSHSESESGIRCVVGVASASAIANQDESFLYPANLFFSILCCLSLKKTNAIRKLVQRKVLALDDVLPTARRENMNNFTTILLYYYATMLLCYYITMLLCYYRSVALAAQTKIKKKEKKSCTR